MTMDWETGKPYPQPTDEEYNKSAVLPGPPAPVVEDLEKATLEQLRKEVAGMRLYISHLYMSYKELVNIKGEMTTTLQSMISIRNSTFGTITPIENKLKDIGDSVNDILEALGIAQEPTEGDKQ